MKLCAMWVSCGVCGDVGAVEETSNVQRPAASHCHSLRANRPPDRQPQVSTVSLALHAGVYPASSLSPLAFYPSWA